VIGAVALYWGRRWGAAASSVLCHAGGPIRDRHVNPMATETLLTVPISAMRYDVVLPLLDGRVTVAFAR